MTCVSCARHSQLESGPFSFASCRRWAGHGPNARCAASLEELRLHSNNVCVLIYKQGVQIRGNHMNDFVQKQIRAMHMNAYECCPITAVGMTRWVDIFGLCVGCRTGQGVRPLVRTWKMCGASVVDQGLPLFPCLGAGQRQHRRNIGVLFRVGC